jgi:hypothetical protein
MSESHVFIRFAGRLWEDMRFEREAGWETERIAERPEEGKGDYLLELRDEDGQALITVAPLVDFERQSTSPQPGMRDTRVIAYLPLHPKGREIVFRRGELILSRERVSEAPPEVTISGLDVNRDDRVRLRWEAKHPEGRPLTYNVVYVVSKERAFSLARGLIRSEYVADLSSLPGSKEGRLSVLATDGIRSGFAVSDPFSISDKPPLLALVSPSDNETMPADQPINLSGQATDVAGASLPSDGLVWRVDGKVVARGTTLALATGLEPGRHTVTIEYRSGRRTLGEQSVTIRVADRSAAQQEFMRQDRE